MVWGIGVARGVVGRGSVCSNAKSTKTENQGTKLILIPAKPSPNGDRGRESGIA